MSNLLTACVEFYLFLLLANAPGLGSIKLQ